MCLGCTNPTVAFTWFGSFLVNAAFIILISWGAAVFWPVGLAFALFYTVLLFGAAFYVKRSRNDMPSFITDILLLLGVIGIGASGSLLCFNLFGCGAPRSYGDGSGGGGLIQWNFPAGASSDADILIWANQPSWQQGNGASFVVHPATTTLFFRGQTAPGVAEAPQEVLWMIRGGLSPAQLDATLTFPTHLVMIAQRVCFVAASAVHCYASDGSNYTTINFASASNANPRALKASNGSLFFKADAPYGYAGELGVVYRSDPPFTTATLLSVPNSGSVPPPSPPVAPGTVPGGDGCDNVVGFRTMAIAFLFITSLPVLLTSVTLWSKLHTPSMSFATFCGVSAVVINVYAIIDPAGSVADIFIRWWFFAFSTAWLVVYVVLKLQNRIDLTTFRWAVDIGCIAYVASMHAIVHVPFTTDWWRWVIYQFTMLLPMVILALVSTNTTTGLPTFLVGLAIFVDAWKITIEMRSFMTSDPTFQTFITFAFLGGIGFVIIFAAMSYNKYKDAITQEVDRFAATFVPMRKPFMNETAMHASSAGAIQMS